MILCSSHLSFKPFLSFSFWLLWACSAHTPLLASKSSVSLLKTPVFICFQQAYISLSQRAVLMSLADNTSVSVISVLASVLVLLSASVESLWCSIGSVFLVKTYTFSAFCMLPVYTVFWCCSNKGNSDLHFANVKWRSEVPLSPINSVGKGSNAAAVLGIQQSLWSSHFPWRGGSSSSLESDRCPCCLYKAFSDTLPVERKGISYYCQVGTRLLLWPAEDMELEKLVTSFRQESSDFLFSDLLHHLGRDWQASHQVGSYLSYFPIAVIRHQNQGTL